MKVKVCGMKYKDNIQELVKLAPDYIGFIFYPKSPRHIGKDLDINMIPPNIKKVGVFVNEDYTTISSIVLKHNLNVVQLHGNESPELCEQLIQSNIEVIKAFSIEDRNDLDKTEAYDNCCSFFLFDTKTEKYGGSGKKFDWSILENYNNKKPIFLSGGITKHDVSTIINIENLNIHAVDINSGFEIEAGLKNINDVNDFIHELREK